MVKGCRCLRSVCRFDSSGDTKRIMDKKNRMILPKTQKVLHAIIAWAIEKMTDEDSRALVNCLLIGDVGLEVGYSHNQLR